MSLVELSNGSQSPVEKATDDLGVRFATEEITTETESLRLLARALPRISGCQFLRKLSLLDFEWSVKGMRSMFLSKLINAAPNLEHFELVPKRVHYGIFFASTTPLSKQTLNQPRSMEWKSVKTLVTAIGLFRSKAAMELAASQLNALSLVDVQGKRGWNLEPTTYSFKSRVGKSLANGKTQFLSSEARRHFGEIESAAILIND